PRRAGLLSFPTRRSSDLQTPEGPGGWTGSPVLPSLSLTASILFTRRDAIGLRCAFSSRGLKPQARLASPAPCAPAQGQGEKLRPDRKSTRLNSSHVSISY